MVRIPFSWLPPDWRGRRRFDEPVEWARLPEFDVGVALRREKRPYGHDNHWFVYVRRFNEADVVSFPVLSQSVFIGPTGPTTQTVTSSATWNNNQNTVEAIGAGGAGGVGSTTSLSGGGGGGGGYSRGVNIQITTPGTTTFRVRVGRGGTFSPSPDAATSMDGGDSWFDTAGGSPDVFPSSGTAVGARGGRGAHGTSPDAASTTGLFGGLGGQATAAVGAYVSPTAGRIIFSGGKGGDSGNSATSGGGGGGAAGQHADGNAGGLGAGAGGDGDGGAANKGGLGGPTGSPGLVGGNGTNIDNVVGSGAGGGGANAGPGTGGAGGLYGGGGGGGGRSNGTGGNGAQGIVVLTWDPNSWLPGLIDSPIVRLLPFIASTAFAFDAPATRNLAPALFVDADTIYTPPTVVRAVAPPSYAVTGPLVLYPRQPWRLTQGEIRAPLPQDQQLLPGLFTDADVFFAPVVAQSGVTTTWLPDPLVSPVRRRGLVLPNKPAVSVVIAQPFDDVDPDLFADPDVFYAASVSNNIWTPEAVSSPLFVETRSVASTEFQSVQPPGASDQALLPGLFTDADVFYSPTVAGTSLGAQYAFSGASPLYVRRVATFALPSVAVVIDETLDDIAPDLLVDDDVFYGPTIQQPSWTPEVLASPRTPQPRRTYLQATAGEIKSVIQTGAVFPGLYVDGDVFYAPIVGGGAGPAPWQPEPLVSPRRLRPWQPPSASGEIKAGLPQTQNLLPGLFSDVDVFFAPTLVQSQSFWTPEPLRSPRAQLRRNVAFMPRTFNVEAQQSYLLLPGLLTDADVFFAPSVSSVGAISPPLFVDADVFFAPVVGSTYSLLPGLFSDADVFFAQTVASVAFVAPPLFVDADVFYPPTLVGGFTSPTDPDRIIIATGVDSDRVIIPTGIDSDRVIIATDGSTEVNPT